MSLAAVERGPQPSGREANIINAKEVFASAKHQEYFDSLPNLFLAQQTLLGRDFTPNLFVARAAEETLDRIATPLKYGGTTAGLIVVSSVLAACGSPGEARNVVTNPIDPAKAAAACEPAKFAESIGVPTPVGIGGSSKDRPLPDNIVASRFKIEKCQPLTSQEIEEVRKFNIQTENAALVEQAIQNGKIEVNNQAEAAKIFTPVSQEEAANLEAKAKQEGKVAFFPPVKNMDKHSKIEIGKITITGVQGTALGINGLEPGDIIISPISGQARLMPPGKSGSNNYYLLEIINGSKILQIMLKDLSARELIETRVHTEVKPGDPILEAVSPEHFPEIYKGYQAVIGLREGNTFQELSLDSLVRRNSTFASIS